MVEKTEDPQLVEEQKERLINKLADIASIPLPKIDTVESRKEAQIALGDKDVDIKDLKSQLKQIKEDQSVDKVTQLEEQLKATQMTNEALKGILGQFVQFLEAFLPEIQKTAGDHTSFFQIQQMVTIGKMLAGEPIPENIKKDLEKK